MLSFEQFQQWQPLEDHSAYVEKIRARLQADICEAMGIDAKSLPTVQDGAYSLTEQWAKAFAQAVRSGEFYERICYEACVAENKENT